MKNLFTYLEREVPNSIYLSFFRLFICFHLLKKIILLTPSNHILYSNTSFVYHDEILIFGSIPLSFFREHYEILISVYVLLIGLFVFGIGKNIVALLLYIIFRLFQTMNGSVANGGDNLLSFIMLYMVFANSFDYLAIKTTNKAESSNKIYIFFTNLSCYAILIHLCVVYFFSAVGKINTSEWYKGVALYYTLLSDRFNGTPYNALLVKNGYFTTLGTYFTLLFEISFPFLIWIKNMRIPMIICGIILHLSIYIFMMIHDFQILFIFIYGLFFTNLELFNFYNTLKIKLSKILKIAQLAR